MAWPSKRLARARPHPRAAAVRTGSGVEWLGPQAGPRRQGGPARARRARGGQARRGDGRDPAREARAPRGAPADAGHEDARGDGARRARPRRSAPRARTVGREAAVAAVSMMPRAARAAQRRARGIPRSRAQVDRRLREGRPGGGRRQGARPLRLAPGGADAHCRGARQRGRAPRRACGSRRPRRSSGWERRRGGRVFAWESATRIARDPNAAQARPRDPARGTPRADPGSSRWRGPPCARSSRRAGDGLRPAGVLGSIRASSGCPRRRSARATTRTRTSTSPTLLERPPQEA